MTPDLLTQLITDLRGLVATLGPAADLVYQFAGADPHGTLRGSTCGLSAESKLGTEDQDVPDRGLAPAA